MSESYYFNLFQESRIAMLEQVITFLRLINNNINRNKQNNTQEKYKEIQTLAQTGLVKIG